MFCTAPEPNCCKYFDRGFCQYESDNTKHCEYAMQDVYKNDMEQLKNLCRELLAGADKYCVEPYSIVQPFVGILKRYNSIIIKYDLM